MWSSVTCGLARTAVGSLRRVTFSASRITSRERDTWANEIGAFANSEGGVLLLGVTDKGVVTGMSREQLDMVEQAVREISVDSVKPPVRVQTYRRELLGRAFLLVAVPRGDTQHESPGGVISACRRCEGAVVV